MFGRGIPSRLNLVCNRQEHCLKLCWYWPKMYLRVGKEEREELLSFDIVSFVTTSAAPVVYAILSNLKQFKALVLPV